MNKTLTKTIVFSFLALVFVAAAGFLFTACGHSHTFAKWTTVKEATCTEDGEEKGICECGETKTRVIPAKGHSYGEWDITAETCTEDGIKVRFCEVCGHKDSVVLPAGHKPKVVEGTAATCEESGLTDGEICDVCGKTLKAQTEIAPLGHAYGNWTPSGDFDVDKHNGTHYKECERCQRREVGECDYYTEEHPATCEEGGYNIHYCKTCGNKFKHDETDPLGHIWIERYVFVENENGTHMHSQVCYRDETHRNTPEACEDTDGGEVVEKTCTTKGYTKNICTKCGHDWETDVQEPIGHDWQNVQPLDHVEGQAEHHEYTCSNCSEKMTQLCDENETFKAATCTTPSQRTFKCKVCQREREDTSSVQEALGHSYLSWQHFVEDDVHKHKHQCLRCKEWETNTCEFTDDKSKLPTCVNPGTQVLYCKECKFSETTPLEKLNHDWGDYQRKTDASHVRICQRQGCGAQEITKCEFYVLSATPSSCTENVKTTYKCSLCQQQKEHVTQLAPGHLYPATVDEDPTLWTIDEDYHTRKCIRCGEVSKERHNFSESNLCKLCKHDGLGYEIVDGHAVLYDNSRVSLARNIIVAAQYEGVPVTVVESKFNKNTGTYVGFYNNQFIETLVLPQTLESIGPSCFSRCGRLKTVSIAGEGLEDFNPALKRIGDNAFAYCGNLTSASNLPDGLEHIGKYAFYDCTNLNGLTIPDSVVEIGDHAFTNTGYLNNLPSDSVVYVGKHLLRVSSEASGSFEIKEDTVSVASQAFKDCSYLTKITMYGNIKEIGMDAFLGCERLDEVIFKGTYTQWFNIIFENDYASPMSHATKLNIANAVGRVEIPYGITKIPAGTFKGSKVEEVVIPDTVVYVGEEAFENCSELKTITFVDENGEASSKRNWQFIGKNVFAGTTITQQDENKVLYFDVYLIDASGLDTNDYTVREGTVSIAAEAFTSCSDLERITFAASLQYIGSHAFVGCEKLTYLKFEDPTNWFAWTSFGMGRTMRETDIDGKDEGVSRSMCGQIRDFYNGDWRKSKASST